MEKENVFDYELGQINNNALRGFITRCIDAAPAYFFTMAASSTGKYHPAYTLGDGGLIRHTKAAVRIALDLLRNDIYARFRTIQDEIVAALILHDSVKKGFGGNEYTLTNHPLLACDLITGQADKEGLDDMMRAKIIVICDLIATHMGQWNTDYKTGEEVLPKPGSMEQKFVHLCDYLASRKFITITNEDGSAL